jgi:hypothetical protein
MDWILFGKKNDRRRRSKKMDVWEDEKIDERARAAGDAPDPWRERRDGGGGLVPRAGTRLRRRAFA